MSTLKSKAVRLLAQREHSRDELKRKLLLHGQQQIKLRALGRGRDDPHQPDDHDDHDHDDDRDDAPAQRTQLLADIDSAINQLTQCGLQSDERTAQALLQAQSRRLGGYRLKQKLQAKGLAPELVATSLAQTHGTEHQRAFELWSRRFGCKQAPPGQTAAEQRAERARQARFLMARGFAGAIVQKIVGAGRNPTDDDGHRVNSADATEAPHSGFDG